MMMGTSQTTVQPATSLAILVVVDENARDRQMYLTRSVVITDGNPRIQVDAGRKVRMDGQDGPNHDTFYRKRKEGKEEIKDNCISCSPVTLAELQSKPGMATNGGRGLIGGVEGHQTRRPDEVIFVYDISKDPRLVT